MKILSTKKILPDDFTGEFYQMFKQDMVPPKQTCFYKIKEEGIFPNSFYEVGITLIPKSGKDSNENRKPPYPLNTSLTKL